MGRVPGNSRHFIDFSSEKYLIVLSKSFSTLNSISIAINTTSIKICKLKYRDILVQCYEVTKIFKIALVLSTIYNSFSEAKAADFV